MAELRKELSLEQRQLVRDALQGTSRKEVLKAIVPQAGKSKKPQAKKKLSFSKKFKLSVKKKQMNKIPSGYGGPAPQTCSPDLFGGSGLRFHRVWVRMPAG